MTADDLIATFRVTPGEKAGIADRDTGLGDVKKLTGLGKHDLKRHAKEMLAESRKSLAAAQELLYASDTHSVLVILQAMDAAGKDGTIKHVLSGVNPQGCQVFSFKQPSAEELDHVFLWRYAKALPERGRIGIFNRSYYEEVLVVRVLPEVLAREKLPPGRRGKAFWRERYEDINAFERHLVRNGTVVLKFFLNLSKEEQKQRLLARLDDPAKHWKFSAADLDARALWDDYAAAYESALTATSTEWAPWFVVPADHKWATRAAVGEILAGAIGGLDLQVPRLSPAEEAALAEARKRLEDEPPRAARR